MIRGLVAVERGEAVKPFEPLARPRLQARLERALAHRVALVVAPPGFGKSVAVRHYFESVRVPHVAFGLRREHATLLGFLRGLVDALAPLEPGAGKSLVGVYARAMASGRPASELAAWVAAWLKRYVGTVVIDDCHIASADPYVDEFLAELIDRTPDNVRWAILTRASGGLPIATWLAYGTMDLPVDEVDLRFDEDESGAMMRAAGVAMRADDLRQLLALTNGWPTAFAFGLRLSTRAVHVRQIEAGTRDMVYRYLAEQMLGTLTEEEREFLLETCVLPVVDLDVLEAGGRSGSYDVMERLRKKTAFISHESAVSARAFRYHELFRDFLEHELRSRDPQRYRTIVAASAALLERAGEHAHALGLALQADAHDVLARVLSERGSQLIERGYVDVVEQALEALAPARRNAEWRLLALHAEVASSRGRHADADAMYAAAIELPEAFDDRADVAQRFSVALGRRYEHERAGAVIDRFDWSAVGDPLVQLKVLSAQAMVRLMRRDAGAAKPLMERALETAVRVGDPTFRATLNHWSGIVALDLGDIELAHQRASEAIVDAERLGLFGLAARACTTLAEVAHQRCDSPSWQRALSLAARHAERAGEANVALFALCGLYDLAAERGDVAQLAELDVKLKVAPSVQRYVEVGVLSGAAMQAAWNRDFATAHDVLEGTLEGHETAARLALRLAELALFAAAAGRRSEAERYAARCAEQLGRAPHAESRAGRSIKAACLRSLTLIVLGKNALANTAIRALEASAKQQPAPMRALVAAVRALFVHLETGADHQQLSDALATLRARDLGGFARLLEALPLPERNVRSSFGALTEAEIRVLRALATGASSKDVAADLDRSALTIDSHVKSILKKLACKGRLEAVSLARERGIL